MFPKKLPTLSKTEIKLTTAKQPPTTDKALLKACFTVSINWWKQSLSNISNRSCNKGQFSTRLLKQRFLDKILQGNLTSYWFCVPLPLSIIFSCLKHFPCSSSLPVSTLNSIGGCFWEITFVVVSVGNDLYQKGDFIQCLLSPPLGFRFVIDTFVRWRKKWVLYV